MTKYSKVLMLVGLSLSGCSTNTAKYDRTYMMRVEQMKLETASIELSNAKRDQILKDQERICKWYQGVVLECQVRNTNHLYSTKYSSKMANCLSGMGVQNSVNYCGYR
jgi:hypothetical protein